MKIRGVLFDKDGTLIDFLACGWKRRRRSSRNLYAEMDSADAKTWKMHSMNLLGSVMDKSIQTELLPTNPLQK